MDVIVGTAGHIDHGKTALIKALTGVDTDRLPEEKQRGITIDLGFAELTIADTHFGFVDVPGHERFVKNMLAGASGIDLFLLIVAADEGVMPQTREHFDICRLLGVNEGMIVLTKTDLADADTLNLARFSVADLVAGTSFENAAVVEVSATTGVGIGSLKEELGKTVDRVRPRESQTIARLPIDRSFSIRGFGAVVTGTLASGHIIEGAEMELLPDGFKVRVRGIQVHGKSVKTANPGQRVAVNLGGIDHSKVVRGMVLAELNVLRPSQIMDTEIEVLARASKPLRTRQRVRVHVGTVEALARIQVLNNSGKIEPGTRGFAQIRLEGPIVAIQGERFIIRSYSPQITIAGGLVLDNATGKHRHRDFAQVVQYLTDLQRASSSEGRILTIVSNAGSSGLRSSDLQARTAMQKASLTAAFDSNISAGTIVDCGGVFLPTPEFETLCLAAEFAIGKFHESEPLSKGITREELRESAFSFLPNEVFQAVISSIESDGKIVTDKDTIRIAEHKAALSSAETLVSEQLISIYSNAGLAVPKLDEALAHAVSAADLDMQTARKLFERYLDSGEIVKVTEELYFAKRAIDALIDMLRKHAAAGDRTVDVAQFKELAGVSRKYAIPLLEYFDRTRITARSGDKRIIL